jgi:hypothetical protein
MYLVVLDHSPIMCFDVFSTGHRRLPKWRRSFFEILWLHLRHNLKLSFPWLQPQSQLSVTLWRSRPSPIGCYDSSLSRRWRHFTCLGLLLFCCHNSEADSTSHMLLAKLIKCLEAVEMEKALAEEKSAHQAAQQDVRDNHDSVASLTSELTSKEAALEAWSGHEKAAQDTLRTLADEKKALERELSSVRKTFTKRAEVMALTVVHVVGLLKSSVPDHEPKLLREDY